MPLSKKNAVKKIQSTWRGRPARPKTTQKNKAVKATKIQSTWRGVQARKAGKAKQKVKARTMRPTKNVRAMPVFILPPGPLTRTWSINSVNSIRSNVNNVNNYPHTCMKCGDIKVPGNRVCYGCR